MSKVTDNPGVPTVKVSPRGASRLKDGHIWVYRSDIVSADGVRPGTLVTVADHRGQILGSALYSSSSQIALRLISRELVGDFRALLRQRVADAIAYRAPIIQNTNAYRVIFSEADFLPGLIVDRYNDILSMQILTQAMDSEDVRELVTGELAERLHPASVIERVEPRVRQLEELPPRLSSLVQGERTSTIFTMNGVQFHCEALEGCPIRPRRSPRRFLLPGRLRSSSGFALPADRRRRQLSARARGRRPERHAQWPKHRMDRGQRLRSAQTLRFLRPAL
jgi:23S rRNA (cytosine1962-C5)-methyltransferase